MKLQELSEELVNLTVKEVNELAHIMKVDISEPTRYQTKIFDYPSTPKDYGLKLYERKHKKRR